MAAKPNDIIWFVLIWRMNAFKLIYVRVWWRCLANAALYLYDFCRRCYFLHFLFSQINLINWTSFCCPKTHHFQKFHENFLTVHEQYSMIQYEFRQILWPNCNPLYWVIADVLQVIGQTSSSSVCLTLVRVPYVPRYGTTRSVVSIRALCPGQRLCPCDVRTTYRRSDTSLSSSRWPMTKWPSARLKSSQEVSRLLFTKL